MDIIFRTLDQKVARNLRSAIQACRYFYKEAENKYSDTVLLPATTFRLRLDGFQRLETEKMIRKTCNFDGVYEWQSKQNRDKIFVLHDGPPYANGEPHIGHAVNKVLKDITNRYKLLRGYKVHYVPGWDCHGLPIELKALQNEQVNSSSNYVSNHHPLVIRKKARAFAEKSAGIQMQAFRNWGIMANWKECYFTYDKSYIAEQMNLFYQLYDKGLIYRDFKPVFWSYSTRYCIVLCENTLEHFLIALELKEQLESTLSKHFKVIHEFEGSSLNGSTYYHPISAAECPFLPANHITMAKGTGLVHTAPAHGPEDFLVALENKLPVKCLIDDDARFVAELGSSLAGKFVLREGNEEVLKLLAENMVHSETYIHKYPYDWRSKEPVVIRASLQWFINTNKIKDSAIRCLQHVNVHPDIAKSMMISQLDKRPYWCISRQRVWGVPIPVFYDSETKEPFVNKTVIDHLLTLLNKHGSDFWWNLSSDDLLPYSVIKDSGMPCNRKYDRGSDILDIWFDSGSSWAYVLKDHNCMADVFLEGKDQITGWFQSTLLTSCASRSKAPYKTLFVHGFTLDEEGRKMSKSLGNVIDPHDITNGGKDVKKDPPYGVDVLRWWVASHGSCSENIPVGPKLLSSSAENIHKIRIVLRYLLGILNEFDCEAHSVPHQHLLPLDQYMLHLLWHFRNELHNAFDSFTYNRASNLILNFVTNNVSAFYCHLIKDRIYCEGKHSLKRRSCLTVAHHILGKLVLAIAPILPFLSEEVYLHYPVHSKLEPSVFHTVWNESEHTWENQDLANIISDAMQIRHRLNQECTRNSAKTQDYDLKIYAIPDLHHRLKCLHNGTHSSLVELLQVAKLHLFDKLPQDFEKNNNEIDGMITACITRHRDSDDEDSGTLDENARYYLMLSRSSQYLCVRCRRRSAAKSKTLCERCAEVIKEITT